MVWNIILLVTALSVDTFVASAAYGANGIALSARQIAVINGISSFCLGGSLLFGRVIDGWIPETFTREICFCSLLSLGCLKLADSSICQYVRRHKKVQKKICFAFSSLHVLISIYSDPMEADTDGNQSLSWRELLFFSLSLSLDSLFSGTLAAFLKIPIVLTAAAVFLAGELSAYSGLWIGKKITSRCPRDLSWVSGLLFLLLAMTKR